jgi:hypothetical protein
MRSPICVEVDELLSEVDSNISYIWNKENKE